jgi:hypothetical protein
MIAKHLRLLPILFFLILTSCDNNKEIQRLLNGNVTNEIIKGAYKAGLSGDKKYVPALLNNAADGREGTSLRFALFSVYTEKMFALERILKVKPPHPYGKTKTAPDSVNIKFYIELWRNMNKGE